MYIGMIAKLAGEKNDLSARIEKIDKLIELLCGLYGPSELVPPSEPEKPADKPALPARMKKDRKDAGKGVKVAPKNRKYTKRKPDNKVRKGKKSQYKGVKVSKKPYADGRTRYEVSWYDPATQKVKFLGCFDNEYLAAAKYQEHDGDKVEAARLRALAGAGIRPADAAEQEENNPDREKVKGKKHALSVVEGSKGKKVAYKCTNPTCGMEWQTKPAYCPAAGCYGTSFTPIKV